MSVNLPSASNHGVSGRGLCHPAWGSVPPCLGVISSLPGSAPPCLGVSATLPRGHFLPAWGSVPPCLGVISSLPGSTPPFLGGQRHLAWGSAPPCLGQYHPVWEYMASTESNLGQCQPAWVSATLPGTIWHLQNQRNAPEQSPPIQFSCLQQKLAEDRKHLPTMTAPFNMCGYYIY